ncbi:MAG TPA: hypothetical protein V6D00_06125 [Pantanalinema sp.]
MKARSCSGLLGMAVGVVALGGCSEPEPTTYVFRQAPPILSTGTSQATTSVGVLTGKIYLADSEDIDPATGLPKGYRLLDGEAKVSVRVTTTRRTLTGTVSEGGYRVSGVPVGVPLEVTAGRTGAVSKTQAYTMPPSGQGRLSFAYVGGSGDSYLVGPPAYAVPTVKSGK